MSGHWIAIVTVDCESVLCEAREKEGTTTIIERYSNSYNKDRILPQP